MSLCATTVTVSSSSDRLALLDAIFQATPNAVVVLAHDGRILDANRRALAFAGAAAHDVVGHLLWETPGWAARPSLASWLRSAIDKLTTSSEPDGAETTSHDDDGHTWHLALVALPFAETGVACFELSAVDISRRAAAELAIEERERQLRLLTDHMLDLLFLMRVEPTGAFRCESVNPAYLRVTGLSETQVVGRLIDEVLSPGEASLAKDRYHEALASRDPITYRETAMVPAGTLVLEITLTVIRDARQRPTHLMGLVRDVTKEEQTLVALRESEARFRAALNAGQDAFVIVRVEREADGTIRDLVVVDANLRAGTLVQQPVSALIGRSLLEAFPVNQADGLWDQCVRVIATGTPFDLLQPSPTLDQPDRWVQRQIVPLGDGVAISSRDVTARQREHQALESSEARHRELFESSGAIQLIVDDVTGELLDVNPAAEAFYGWPRETMRTMRITDLAGGTIEAWRQDMPALRALVNRASVWSHRVASGERRDVEVATSAVTLLGHAARHLIVHDVSDRVRAETQLRESEARFRAVIGGMSEGVVVHDKIGAIRAFNPSAERILGLSGAELLGLTPVSKDWEAVHEDGTLWPSAEHPAMVALRTGRSQPRALMGVRRSDAEYAWLHVSADPLIRAGEQVPYGSVAVFSDVTAQRSTEERLRAAQKLEAVGQLAGGIAHDFNNLLTVIRGASGFLLESLDADSPHLEDLRAIERAVERAEALTRQLLSVGRRQMLRTESVDLSALVQEQYLTIRNELPPSIRVHLALHPERVLAQLDRRQLLDALRALVDNAREAMTRGGTLTLGTSLQRVERPVADGGPAGVRRYAVLEVTDTGGGMTDEVRARLFEPFFSTQPFGASKGMGLASVNGMVAQSQGFIECDTAPGRGTSLRLYFPAATEAERVATPPSGNVSIATRGVLLVDDDPMVRDLGRRMLERLGQSVASAASGAEALAMLRASAENVSVLLTDLTMPGMSGMELIAEVERDYPAMPIVAISGFAMNPSVRQVLDARQIPFVAKPFTPDDLMRAIERAIDLAARRP